MEMGKKGIISLAFVLAAWLALSPLLSHAYALVSTTSGRPPLTGTFVMLDTNEGAASHLAAMQEMKTAGMDTIIILASGSVDKVGGVYQEYHYLTDPANQTKTIIRLAHENNIDIYIGLVAYDPSKVNHWVGSPTDPNTDKGRLIDMSLRLVDELKTAAAAQGVPWTRIRGFYLGETGPANLATPTVNELVFWKELAVRLKAKAPDKKLLISPYVLQSNTYDYMKSVYVNVFSQTPIDIIAPQDSMGSLKVTTTAKSAELFRALRDATALFPGREAWANIETQLQPSISSIDYNPSTIDRVSGQIEAAAPYVTKMVTWIYQHTMLSVPAFDSTYSWTGQYTPARAGMRKSLRTAYLAKYAAGSAITMYYYHTDLRACQATTAVYVDAASCQYNLSLYLAGKTTGICYPSLTLCQSANPTPTPTRVPTWTPTPTRVLPTATQIPTKRSDINRDTKVDIFDYNILLQYFGRTGAAGFTPADIDRNGKVDIFDYNLLLQDFGK